MISDKSQKKSGGLNNSIKQYWQNLTGVNQMVYTQAELVTHALVTAVFKDFLNLSSFSIMQLKSTEKSIGLPFWVLSAGSSVCQR